MADQNLIAIAKEGLKLTICPPDDADEMADLIRRLEGALAMLRTAAVAVKCEFCERSFKRASELAKHVKTKHPAQADGV